MKEIDKEGVEWLVEMDVLQPNIETRTMTEEMLKNQVELLQEDIECVHMYLDDKHIPRIDSKGREYSIIGRIKILQESYQKQLSELESHYLTFKQQEP